MRLLIICSITMLIGVGMSPAGALRGASRAASRAPGSMPGAVSARAAEALRLAEAVVARPGPEGQVRAAMELSAHLVSGDPGLPSLPSPAPAMTSTLASYPEPHRGALARLLGAAEVYQRATAEARGATGLASIMSARLEVVREARALGALGPPIPPPSPTYVPGLLFVDLGTADSLHTEDVAVLVDGGGDDRYLNNAGSAIVGEACGGPAGIQAALLIDLAGDDVYGSSEAQASCVTNGSAYVDGTLDTVAAAGTLIDLAGSDRYVAAGEVGGNAIGVLIGGDRDTSIATGLLLDADGEDIYESAAENLANAVGYGSSSSQASVGVGTLIDLAGDDRYEGANGFGRYGVGVLVDMRGDDHYAGGAAGSVRTAAGMLVEGAGHDIYDGPTASAFSYALAAVYEGDGNDRYLGASATAQELSAVAAVLDRAGDDEHASVSAWGYGSTAAASFVDEAGDDIYGSTGTSRRDAVVMFADLGGCDRYQAGPEELFRGDPTRGSSWDVPAGSCP